MALLLAALLGVQVSRAVINIPAKTYVLNSSLPASEYYAPVCKDKKQDALYAFAAMLDMIPAGLQSEFEDIAMTYVSHISPYQITSATHKTRFRSGTTGTT